MSGETMKTTEERLANAADEIERQTAMWQEAVRALAALGDVPLRIPAEVLAELDVLDVKVRRTHVAPGGIQV
jgi:hypothetical protein